MPRPSKTCAFGASSKAAYYSLSACYWKTFWQPWVLKFNCCSLSTLLFSDYKESTWCISPNLSSSLRTCVILRRHYVIRESCEIAQPASSAQCVLTQWSIWWFYLISLPVLEIGGCTMPTDVVTIKSGRHFWKVKVTWSIGEITKELLAVV